MKINKILSAVFFLVLASNIFAAPNISVTFVMDESGSVSTSNFQLEKQGFINALNALPTDGSVELSAIGFASGSQTIVNPTTLDSSSFNSVKSSLENNIQSGGGTNMSNAINSAASLLGSSSTLTKIICLATDGAPNSQSATITSANSAKSAGIVLSPIGIGLNSSSQTFLDSIASNPPVPNPADFNEFGTVVTNDCLGLIKSALNIQLTPDPVDFGVFNSQTIDQDLQICAKEPQYVGIQNLSNQPATITKVEIVGEDANDFELVSFMLTPADQLPIAFQLPALFSTQASIRLKPNKTPSDKSYDAALRITAEDSNQVSGEFSTTLIARVDPSFTSCLGVSQIDATPLIASISDIGAPLKADDSVVGEIDVAIALQNDTKGELYRKGLVADGNTRLLLVSKTRQSSGKVRLEILNSTNKTESRLYPLSNTPTYSSQTTTERIYDKKGKTILDLDIATDPDGFGQITAVLRAGERFLSTGEYVDYSIKICILDAGQCGNLTKVIKMRDYKTPVILLHGLWANDSSWKDGFLYKGLETELLADNYMTGFFNYDDTTLNYSDSKYSNHGPSDVMSATETRLSDLIKDGKDGLCDILVEKSVACTRGDLIGHSMGGLVARKYIQDNKNYKSKNNYEQGSVRRLLTLGTPHIGSQLANLLLLDNKVVNNCIQDTDPNTIGLQNSNVREAKTFLRIVGGNRLTDQGAVNDLSVVGGKEGVFINTLNSESQVVPTFAIVGDIGEKIDLGFGTGFLNEQVSDAGCEVTDIFGSEQTDGVVPVISAKGRVQSNTVIDDAQHTGMGKNKKIRKEVLEKLNESIDIWSPSSKLDDYKVPNNNSIWKKVLAGFLTTALGINTAYAEELPSISLQADKTIYQPGETAYLSASTIGSFSSVFITDSTNFEKEDSNSPFSWSLPISKEFSGKLNFIAYGFDNGRMIVSKELEIDVSPDASGLNNINFEPGYQLLLSPGASQNLRLIGLFNDGFKRDISSANTGTIYSENIVNILNITRGDSPVLSISSGGIVTAEHPGVAEVVATNNGKTTVRRIKVVAVSKDDADGDNITDIQEDLLGTNKFHPDSDGDGSSDGIEVGSDSTSPMNSDGTGAIDALEKKTITIKDSTGKFISIKTSEGTLFTPYGKKLTDYPTRTGSSAQVQMERGLLSFRVEDLTPGQSIDVTLTFDSLPVGINRYLKYGSKLPEGGSPEWYDFPDFDVKGNTITLHLTDNQLGDSNPVPGVINDPGGPGVGAPLDTDIDGIPDSFEDANGLDKTDPTDAFLDGDMDGLNNLEEFQNNTNPANRDTDGDGARDGEEVAAGTDPLDSASFPPPSAQSIPTLSEWAIILLVLVLGLLGLGQAKRRFNS